MIDNKKVNICLILFVVSFLARLLFYWAGLAYLPGNFQKFVTADTVFYYDPAAINMASGSIIEPSLLNVSRFTFLGYLSLFYRCFGHVYWPVSVFHCFLGALTVVFLFLSAKLFLTMRTAFIIGLIASFHPILIYWTPFVTTEAFFLFIVSLSLFMFSLSIKRQRLIYIFALILCLAVSFISRPLGITFSLFMFFLLEWLALRQLSHRKGRLYFYLLNFAILVTVFVFVLRNTQKIDAVLKQPYPQQLLNMSLYLDEMPERQVGKGYLTVHAARLSLPRGMMVPKSSLYPQKILTGDIVTYFKADYKKYITLVILRFYTLFNPWVPEYSPRHNIFNIFFYGFTYIFSLIGLARLWKIERDFTILILLGFGSQILLIGLTIVDYDFRLRLPLELLLIVPTGIGISKLFNPLYNRNEL